MTNHTAAADKYTDPKAMADWIRSQQTERPALDYLRALKTAQSNARFTDITSKKALRVLDSAIWPLDAQVKELRGRGLAWDEIANDLFDRDEEGCLFPNLNADSIDRWDRI